MAARNLNLDICRALAIVMILVHHGVQMSPIDSALVRAIANLGQYGVDLFFVLSGWLIGGLYWREKFEFGSVDVRRFWVRRWLRTIPAYLLVLAASYLAVYLARREPFDFGYLIFAQNYYTKIPFFLVSWSLCIEEHFYLVAPLLLIPFATFRYRRGAVLLLAVLFFMPAVFRLMTYPGERPDFGFAETATHLRFEGLFIGFLGAYVAQACPADFRRLVRLSPWLAIAGLVTAAALLTMGGRIQYTYLYSALALVFGALIFKSASMAAGPKLLGVVCRPIALVSYSLYLAHPLALHAARVAAERAPHAQTLAYFAIALALTAGFTVALFFVAEKASLKLRERVAPRRSDEKKADDARSVSTAQAL